MKLNYRFYVTLKYADGNLLTGVKVKLVWGDIDILLRLMPKGKISTYLKNLAVGNYAARIYCGGAEIYCASSTTASVIIC